MCLGALAACKRDEVEETTDPDEVLPLVAPLATPTDPLADSAQESCSVYEEQRCEDGVEQTCNVFDVSSTAFVSSPDALFKRALLYDRWYDLYHQPDGVTANRVFKEGQPAGTLESVWGTDVAFGSYNGAGDGAIWTGKALMADALRYAQTGTRTDYERMEDKVRALVTLFDVTGVPGYLARYPYIQMESGTPNSPKHVLQFGDGNQDHRDHLMTATDVPDLSSDFVNGVTIDGETYTGIARWRGNPSIDQYTGPMIAFPQVYSLIEDPELQERMTTHITCYLHRLQRIEIINLQENPEVLELATQYFSGLGGDVDDLELDLSTIDTLVAFGLPQLNSVNDSTFDRTCPSELPTEATRVIDATSATFFADVLELATDLQSADNERPNGIDHLYVPSVRGGDAVHMMHLAAMSYYFTQDQKYLDFLEDDLIANIGTITIAHTTGAFEMPKWCRSFYGTHITISPLWSFLRLLGESELSTELQQVMEEELWQGNVSDLRHISMDLYYAGTVGDDLGTEQSFARERAVADLGAYGGNGGVLEGPRRGVSISRSDSISALEEVGIEVECPTEQERSICEDGFTVMGVTVPGESITRECRDQEGECEFEDACADPMAAEGTPPQLRPWEDYQWQRSAYKLGTQYSNEETKQAPGIDFTEAFWLARVDGVISNGQGQVLAWEETGTCD